MKSESEGGKRRRTRRGPVAVTPVADATYPPPTFSCGLRSSTAIIGSYEPQRNEIIIHGASTETCKKACVIFFFK